MKILLEPVSFFTTTKSFNKIKKSPETNQPSKKLIRNLIKCFYIFDPFVSEGLIVQKCCVCSALEANSTLACAVLKDIK